MIEREGSAMARFAIACAIGFASVVGFVALPASATEPDPMLARVGAEMFQQYCASCHGTSADGKGPVAPALKTMPADLTRIAARRGGEFPDAEISRWIDGRFDVVAHGTREMPIWGRKFQETIGAGTDPDAVVRGRVLTLVEYLKTIQQK
jgi:mono/diheme cytochrome c family protein